MKSDRFTNNKGNRRRFLGSTAGVAAGMMSLKAATAGSANSNLQVGIVGVRARGRQLIKRFANQPGVTIRAICDIDPAQANRAAGELHDLQAADFRTERDYCSLLASGDVDAVVIATPDHWHAPMTIDAVAANKHVFVETPLTHSIDETTAVLNAASDSDRVLFCGMQQRSMSHMRSALNHIADGHLGSVRLARAWTSHRRKSIGTAPDGPPPIGVDYSHWLGPAPSREFNPNRFHYSWRWFWDYGGGELTNWGVHMIDMARLGLFGSRLHSGVAGVGARDERNPGASFAGSVQPRPPTTIHATGGKYYFTDDDQETPDTLTVNYDFGDRTLIWEHRQWCPRQIEGRSAGVAFYGEHGTLILDRGGWKVYDSNEKVAATESGSGDTVVEDFVAAVRSNDVTRHGLVSIAATTNLCHAANQEYRQG